MPSKHGLVLAVALCIVTLTGLSGVAAETPEATGFDVEITDANATVTAGDPVVVTATVTNNGDETESQQIHLKDFDEAIVDSVAHPPLSLAPGESETVRLVWTTTADDTGNGTVSVQSNDDYPRQELTVRAAPAVETTVGSVDSETEVGEPVTVSVSVENTGDQEATSEVWLALNGSETTNRTVTVAAGATEQVDLTWTPTADDDGPYTLTAGTDDDHSDHQITVNGSSEPTASTEPTSNEPGDPAQSSGGGSPPNVRDRLNAPITGASATFPGGDIKRITFDTETISGDVVATRFADHPDGVDAADHAVGYYEITMPEEAAGQTATIQFQLSEQTLDTTDSQRIGVRQWNGTEWESRQATISNHSDGKEIVVDAVGNSGGTDGGTVFAVTVGDSPPASLAATTTEQEPDEQTNETGGQPSGDGAVANPLINTTGGIGAVIVFGAVSLLLGSRYRFQNA